MRPCPHPATREERCRQQRGYRTARQQTGATARHANKPLRSPQQRGSCARTSSSHLVRTAIAATRSEECAGAWPQITCCAQALSAQDPCTARTMFSRPSRMPPCPSRSGFGRTTAYTPHLRRRAHRDARGVTKLWRARQSAPRRRNRGCGRSRRRAARE